jgi:hypothetical protein
VLLVIAVVGAVVLARRVRREDLVDDPLLRAHNEELAAAEAAEADEVASVVDDGRESEVDA